MSIVWDVNTVHDNAVRFLTLYKLVCVFTIGLKL